MCISCSASRFHFILIVFLVSVSRHCESLPTSIWKRFPARGLAEEEVHDHDDHKEDHDEHHVAWTEIQEFLTFANEEHMAKTKLNSLLKALNEMKKAQTAGADAHADHAHADEAEHTYEVDHVDEVDHADHDEHTTSVSAAWLIDEFGNTTSQTLNPKHFEEASVAIISCMIREECVFEIVEEEVTAAKTNRHLDLKGMLLVVIFFLGIVGGMVPLACYSVLDREMFAWGMGLANSFSGGVFIGSAFLHLLPHVVEEAEHVDMDTDFPVPYALVLVGYFFVFAIEKILFHAHHHENPHKSAPENSEAPDEASEDMGIVKIDLSLETKETVKGEVSGDSFRGLQSRSTKALQSLKDSKVFNGVFTKYGHLQSSVLLFLAISCHAVIAGIALGIQSDRQDVFLVFWAILAHKSVVALSLGVKFLTDGASTFQTMTLLTAFSLVSPIGILIGMAIDNENGTTSMILNGISAGTFLYIGATEVVVDEFELSASAYLSADKYRTENHFSISREHAHVKDRRIKFFCMLFGVGVIALASLTPAHDH
eukprot:CAMPEP_0196575542 /NCGR_PEP_ID=MMETSP1081-20130531/4996_1 /TAXON_ID=36882 /ORGANISM="Pyramimonas amylifera, Strain CCMP720" /LENGTH=539 /DNA_ID=CAMNT_0041893879 /DNA_START=46 /DNA_END=1665 /DNA_ORIENTATION=-